MEHEWRDNARRWDNATLNFPLGDNRANGVTAPLGAGGVLWITYVGSVGGATTDLLFDVTGYFVP